MMNNTFSELEYIEAHLKAGATLDTTQKSMYGLANAFKTEYSAILRNPSNGFLESATSKVSERVAFESINEKLRKKQLEKNQIKSHYKKFVAEVEEITRMYFNNMLTNSSKEKAETYQGWDAVIYTDNTIEIKIHNAANPVIRFNALQEHGVVKMDLVIGGISYWSDLKLRAFSKIMGAIDDYISTPLSEREAELNERMKGRFVV